MGCSGLYALAGIIRHINKVVLEGQMLDADSGHDHIGHIIANVIFLDHYTRNYKEGDDRPPMYKEEVK